MNGSLELAASDIRHFPYYIVSGKRYGKSSVSECSVWTTVGENYPGEVQQMQQLG